MQRALTNRLAKELSILAESRPEDYKTFWREFGVFIKEGIATDPASHELLRDVLRFHSSKANGGDGLVSLKEYVSRMQGDQKAIYYILSDDLKSVVHSPHLDYFRAKDLEVLYLVDALDSFMAMALKEYDGKPLQNVDDASLDLPEASPPTQPEAGQMLSQADFDRLVARFKAVLGDQVTDVRASKRLTDSPCRLVSPAAGPDRDLQRVRRLIEQEYQIPKKILELNRGHALIQNLARRLAEGPDEALVDMAVQQLFDNALLLEGLHPNPADMTPRIQALMAAALATRGAPQE
jgi:molecular chaperone HtpG